MISSSGGAVLELLQADLAPPGRAAPVLEDVTLRLDRGEIAVVCGANGSGKTTLLRTAAGLWPLRAGTMRPAAPEGFDLRRAGLILEDPASQFTAGSVRGEIEFVLENLDLPREGIARRVEEILAGLGLGALAEADPARLSPGEQEKALVAAAVAAEPALLLLDDPFLYLGPWEARSTWDWIVATVRQGRIAALLLATHDPELFGDADHLGILAGGRLAAWGRPEDVWRGPATGELDPTDRPGPAAEGLDPHAS